MVNMTRRVMRFRTSSPTLCPTGVMVLPDSEEAEDFADSLESQFQRQTTRRNRQSLRRLKRCCEHTPLLSKVSLV